MYSLIIFRYPFFHYNIARSWSILYLKLIQIILFSLYSEDICSNTHLKPSQNFSQFLEDCDYASTCINESPEDQDRLGSVNEI